MSVQFLPRLNGVGNLDQLNSIIFYSELFRTFNGIKDPVELVGPEIKKMSRV